MKKTKLLQLILLLLMLAFPQTGCGDYYNSAKAPEAETGSASRTRSSAEGADLSGVEFTPWDVSAASLQVEKRAKKPYTIMVFMNGSDLESEEGAATDDLIEMLESGLDADAANLVLFTGGANRWQNDVVPDNECALWEIENGLLYEICRVGLLNMGNPGTLAGFIDFGMNNFPADKYGLIMWDHGGGSIVGYGHDEKFVKSNLTLLDMSCAFKKSAAGRQKLEFLGFDSCLMASAEMAAVAADYAKYLIASEDLEPGGGWDYGFLSVLSENPGIDGAFLGKEIVDSFMDFYGPNTDEILTLSVTDLSKIEPLTKALDSLMASASESLTENTPQSFRTLSGKRNITKTFGEGTPRDNDCDMVDAGDMAAKLADEYPKESANVLSRLSDCVIYNRHNSDLPLKGLSVYYIYGGKRFGKESLEMYRSLNVNSEYARYLESFFGLLVGGGGAARRRSGGGAEEEPASVRLTLWQRLEGKGFIMTGMKEGAYIGAAPASEAAKELWPVINGRNVCLYKVNSTQGGGYYAIPAEHNGAPCDIIALMNEKHPNGKILGTRKEEGIVIQKGYDKIEEGDKIAFSYQLLDAPEGTRGPLPTLLKKASGTKIDRESWYKSDEFTVAGEPELEWLPAGENSYAALLAADVGGGEAMTELERVKTRR